MVSIRKAEIRDAAAIAHVHVQSWLTTYAGILPAEYLASLNEAERVPLWEAWLAQDFCVFVAEVDGVLLGFAGAGPLREPLGAYDAELYAIYLLREAQGRGIGGDLVHAIAASLIAKGFSNLLVWVLEQNPAVRFYEHLGGQHVESKQVEMGGASLCELALGWSDLKALVAEVSITP